MRIPRGRDRRFRNISRRDVNDISRLFHLFVSLQILFGSRRGVSFLLPLLLIGALAVGGWFIFKGVAGPQRSLEKAHANWDSGVTTKQQDAIVKYKELLQKDNPIEPGTRWLLSDRDLLYRRIVEYEYLYEKNERSARDWIIRAFDEGLRDLRLPPGEVTDFWDKTLQELGGRSPKQDSRRGDKASEKTGKFEIDPRLDGLIPGT